MVALERATENRVDVIGMVDERQLSKRCRRRLAQILRVDHGLIDEPFPERVILRHRKGVAVGEREYESIGVEGRAGYYEEAGALRDMIQNHLLQVMSTIAMEPPPPLAPPSPPYDRLTPGNIFWRSAMPLRHCVNKNKEE